MTRVTPRLLFALAALLLAAWIVVPVSTSPPVPVPLAAAPQALAMRPELEAINREVDRLHERLAEPAPNATPVRDPFQFVDAAPDRVGRPADDRLLDQSPTMTAPRVVWPMLVAILSSGDDTAPVWRAVFEDGSQLVQIRTVGETIGDVVVTDVTGDAATLTHTPSGESTRVPLR